MANSQSLGALIRQARKQAGLTQEALAQKINGLTAADIGKAERGEKTPTQAQLKDIARATGVTQTSLLQAAKAGSKTNSKTGTSSAKTSSKAGTSAKTSGKTSTGSKASAKTSSMQVTAAEKRLLELYRAADSKSRKTATAVLQGESLTDQFIGSMIGTAMDTITGKKAR